MTLLAILFATLAAGIGSVWVAAGLMRLGFRGADEAGGPLPGGQHLLSLAAGALLATSFVHLLPEAFESQVAPKALFATLLIGLVFFFLLDKAELWHHGHEHHHGPVAPDDTYGHPHLHPHPNPHQDTHGQAHAHGHAHHHAHAHAHVPGERLSGGWAVLTGDSVHCFGDGILIASAFVADWRLGLVAALSVMAHEVPHHIGDLVVLRASSSDRRAALLKVSLAGALTALGGLVGWWLVEELKVHLPFFLVVACSSFIYVALADLIPQLQRRLGARETLVQVAWLLAGIGMVMLVSGLAHAD